MERRCKIENGRVLLKLVDVTNPSIYTYGSYTYNRASHDDGCGDENDGGDDDEEGGVDVDDSVDDDGGEYVDNDD